MRKIVLCLATAALAVATPAGASSVIDPVGDLLATFTGAASADLDIVGASVTFDGTNFALSATQAGAIGASANSLYVWGINRGAGTPRLSFGSPSIGADVLFDAVAVFFPDGVSRIVTFPAMGAPVITQFAAGATVNGNVISGLASLALLPSTGFAAEDYTFTLWSRLRVNPVADGLNSEIADFAPPLSAGVPEPGAWMMMIAGFGLIGALFRRRRIRPVALA